MQEKQKKEQAELKALAAKGECEVQGVSMQLRRHNLGHVEGRCLVFSQHIITS